MKELNEITIKKVKLREMDREKLHLFLVTKKIENSTWEKDDIEFFSKNILEISFKKVSEMKYNIPWNELNFSYFDNYIIEKLADILFSDDYDGFPIILDGRKICAKEIIRREISLTSDGTLQRKILVNSGCDELEIFLQSLSFQNRFVSILLKDYEENENDDSLIPFELISKFCCLNANILSKYKEKLNWDLISEYHFLSEDFLYMFGDYLNLEILEKRLED